MNKMTSAELANILNKNPRTISVWENTREIGKVKITVGIIVELCNHFNLPIEFFFESNDQNNPDEVLKEIIPVSPLTYKILTDFRNDVKQLNEKYIQETERLNHVLSEKDIEIIQLKYELRQKEKDLNTLKTRSDHQTTKDILYSKVK